MTTAEIQEMYKQLYKPVEEKMGPLDPTSIVALIGFDMGGPLNLRTIGRERGEKFITYISCELICRDDQKNGKIGLYEVMMICDDERWCRKVLTRIGRMTLDEVFGHHHTLDIGEWVDELCPMQGIVFEEFACVEIRGKPHGILRCHGMTRPEMEFAIEYGSEEVLDRLKRAGVYPNTSITRYESVVPDR